MRPEPDHPLHTLRVAAELAARRNVNALAFYLDSIGEAQFSLPIMRGWLAAHPDDLIVVAHRGRTWLELERLVPDLVARVRHVSWRHFQAGLLRSVDLFLSSSQGVIGPRGVFAIATFHGQPSKGLTFSVETVEGYDAFFLYGPLHRQTFNEYVALVPTARTDHLRLVEVGYPKSDELLQGAFRRDEVLAALGLDPARPTVLYAPAFNDGASMREAGEDIVRSLAAAGRFNVIVKLAIDCLQPTTDVYATGGVDWPAVFSRMQSEHPDVRLAAETRVDPLLAAADVLVTCVSSVSFEMLALGKPVVFFDTPAFFSRFLRARFPGEDTTAWADRTTVNAGREFGPLVRHAGELPGVIDDVLHHPETYPLQRERLRTLLLHNPGRGTAAAVQAIESILAERPRSRRPRSSGTVVTAAGRRLARFGRETLVGPLRRAGARALHARGLALAHIGAGYLDVAQTTGAARAAGLSLCDYLESRESDTRKRGRRDRIVARLEAAGVLRHCERVVEIGAGTGMFLERVMAVARPSWYEVYEPDRGWTDYLRDTYGAGAVTRLVVRAADGETLADTPARACGLVHAHAVFVYIPLVRSFSYLAEAARVLAPGGHLVFDALLDVDFGSEAVEAWLRGPWRFPVILPERLLLERASAHGLDLVDRFSEIYGSTSSEYLIFRKRAAPSGGGQPAG